MNKKLINCTRRVGCARGANKSVQLSQNDAGIAFLKGNAKTPPPQCHKFGFIATTLFICGAISDNLEEVDGLFPPFSEMLKDKRSYLCTETSGLYKMTVLFYLFFLSYRSSVAIHFSADVNKLFIVRMSQGNVQLGIGKTASIERYDIWTTKTGA